MKKSLKIIGKVSCVALLVSVMLTALVIPSFAWQNTNRFVSEQWYRGVNSYSLAPLNSLYYNYWYSSDYYWTNYSVNAPNVITSDGKANWGGVGYPLTARYSEKFGVNNRGTMYTYSWDIFAQNSEFPPLVDLPRENIITVENNDNVSVYPAFKQDEIWTGGSNYGTNLDVVSYVLTRSPDTDDMVRLECYFDPFISTQSFSKYLITYQWATTDIETSPLLIKYAFTYADQENELHLVNGSMYYNGYADGSLTQSGVTYEVDSVSVLDAILAYEQEVNDRQGLDRESQQLIEWNSVYVSIDPDSSNEIVQCGVSIPYLRPYNESLVQSADEGNSTYLTGWYSTISPYQNTIWHTLFTREAPEKLPPLEIGVLGESVGNAVEGVFQAEIFPNVPIWTVLLIPFSLGLVFTFIKFFAGG